MASGMNTRGSMGRRVGDGPGVADWVAVGDGVRVTVGQGASGQQVVSATSSTNIALRRPSPSLNVPMVTVIVLPRYRVRSSWPDCQACALLRVHNPGGNKVPSAA